MSVLLSVRYILNFRFKFLFATTKQKDVKLDVEPYPEPKKTAVVGLTSLYRFTLPMIKQCTFGFRK